ncbi:MAG: 30S ribosomal protein S8 [Candidatus Peribacteraceae bacterium]|nr:30S ribosomal protein S8 [Candidatus Peribacteraceae bacterium]
MSHMSDPIGDLLTRMRNAQRVRHEECRAPWSRVKEELATLLKKEGWIAECSVEGEGISREIVIRFAEGKNALELKRVSKPGRRVYAGYQDLQPILRGYGMAVLTTSTGLMTDRDARKKRVGGEVLCTIA